MAGPRRRAWRKHWRRSRPCGTLRPWKRYDQSLCVLGLRLGIKLRQCSCGAPVSAFGQHKQHGVKHHAEMSPATVAIVRDLTRSDDAVWRAATERV